MEEINETQATTLQNVKQKEKSAKRVQVVNVKIVKETSFLYANRYVRSPEDGYELLKEHLEDVDREHFVVAALDTKNQPISINTVHVGCLNSSIVHPREVMKPAILSNAASIVVAHNHPSGDPDPSKEDIKVTERLAKAGRVLGIELLDHVILGRTTVAFKKSI
ncbi:JAB domain-containing protein [Salimicrobium halophilum]|uniref:DNA repair protein RadC n=1 Tax=Salimicrobium halophilum TaxID=86666 RepID=A0A1G8SEB0_9BACI|nr:JAB domain-containing protein [Salimicrobium halophilum]SDJ27569.1 DNA repair protein RadC [Salimicrobium halophilum]